MKACIAKKTRRHDFPDKNLVIKSWDHDLTKLLEVAGLSTELRNQPNLDQNWSLVKDWRNESRYGQATPQAAKDLYDAVVARTNGILPWIRRHW